MLNLRVIPASMNALETTALTEKQPKKVQVSENNLVRLIVGVQRGDERRMDERRVELGVKENFKQEIDTGWSCGENGREQMPRKWKGKGGDEDQNWDEGLH